MRRRATSEVSISARARARISECSVMWLLAGSCGAPSRARSRAAAMRSIVNGCERSHGYWLLSLSRLTSSSRPNMAAMPDGAKPASVITSWPNASASASIWREKVSWPVAIAAWPPVITAIGTSPLRLLVAMIRPISIAAIVTMLWWLLATMLRAMWRCVMCDSSWPITEAISSREPDCAIMPRFTPM